MALNRREFMKSAAAAGGLAALGGISHLGFAAQAGEQPLLLTVFLRGGADGLQWVAPTADGDYIGARPPELRVMEGGEHAGIVLDNSLDATLGFCLHPNAAALAELYRADRLAIVHAVGLKNGTRSHFVAQDLIERGHGDEKRLNETKSGWLARAFAHRQTIVSGYSATPAPAFALHGMDQLLSAPDLAAGVSAPWGAPTSRLLRSLAEAGETPAHQAYRAALHVLEAVDQHAPKDTAGKWMPYRPGGKANYDGAGDLARPLASVARLVRMDIGLNVACVDHGGWDTHEGQAGRIGNQIRQLSSGLAAFHEDMAAAGRKIVVVVMTEFGRRLRANKSGGADHGHGACWLVLGDRVRGGRMYGRWPGLATPQLDQGVDLAVTTDYRTLLGEVLSAVKGSARDAFPGWKPDLPLNLLAGD